MQVLCFEERRPPRRVAERFGIGADGMLSYIERLRLVDGVALAWDQRWMPTEFGRRVTAGDLATTSLFSLLVAHGFGVADMSFEIHAHAATAEQAQRLGCARNGTVLRREIVCTAPGGESIIVGTSEYPAERVTYRARLTFDASYQPTHL